MSALYEKISTAQYAGEYPHIDLIEYCALSGVALCITDAKGIIRYVNDAYCRITGLSAPDCIGKSEPFEDAVASDVGRTGQALIRAKHYLNPSDAGGRYITAIPICHQDNSVRFVAITVDSDDTIRRRYLAMSEAKLRAESSVPIQDKSAEITSLPQILGNSSAIQELKQMIRRVAATKATVLIQGESGVGKEVIADSIHCLSDRKEKPFVKINCSAIPEHLLESEMFGYERGAFTGASPKGRDGFFQMANGGTLFLDEIGDFPLALQPKLLRALQNHEFYRVGGSTPVKTNVRILAATNSDLQQKIRDGRFREDLYYRLCVVPLSVPPLRERPEDIEPLVQKFLKEYCMTYHRTIEMSPTIMDILRHYKWPGNVRELQNVVEYYVICSDEEREMSKDTLLSILGQAEAMEVPHSGYQGLVQDRNEFEKRLISETIRAAGNMSEAAERLKISRATLYRKLKQFNISTDGLK